MALYKQKCMRCKKNWVTISHRTRFVVCWDCQKADLQGEITDPKMKKMFDLPESYYQANSFLRSIKINYLKFHNLTEKQIAAFKKAVEKMKADGN